MRKMLLGLIVLLLVSCSGSFYYTETDNTKLTEKEFNILTIRLTKHETLDSYIIEKEIGRFEIDYVYQYTKFESETEICHCYRWVYGSNYKYISINIWTDKEGNYNKNKCSYSKSF